MRRSLAIAWLVLAGCNRMANAIDFERMIDQPKYEAYEADARRPLVGIMRVPPRDTVPRERPLRSPATTGVDANGRFVETIPVQVEAAMLQRGRDRFNRFCATCHGVLGQSNTPVANNMVLRRPPSLHRRDIVQQPPGRVFQTITTGYGLMPSYAQEIELEDRWAVIGYLQALRLSQQATLSALPDPLQQEARRSLP